MTIFGYTPAQLKKTLISAVGFTLMVLTAAVPVVPPVDLPYTLAAIGFLTTLGVFLAKNAPLSAWQAGKKASAAPPL